MLGGMATPVQDRVSLAMLAVNSGKGLTPTEIAASWRAAWPDQPQPDEVKKDRGTMSFRIAGSHVVIAAIPMPLPAPELEAAIQRSWLWPEARSATAGHKAHVIVTVLDGDLDPVPRATLLTRVIAALARVGDVAAVYWGSASLLIEPADFVERATSSLSEGGLPLPLWVNVLLSTEKRRTTASTRGLEALGHREFEVVDSKVDPEGLFEFLGGVISYVTENGPVLKHGETIGLSAKHKVKIEHCASAFNPGQRVIRLHA